MICFIINPAAGNGSAHHAIWEIEKYMSKKHLKYKIAITKYPKHAIFLTEKNIKAGIKKIVAVGGDGTVFEIATGIGRSMNKDIILGILPFGTGNDFVRTVGIPKNLKKSLDIITGDKTKDVDLIKVDNLYYINIASIGIDAEIVNYSYEVKEKFKGASYFVSILKNIITYKPYKAVMKIDGKIIENEFTLIAIANGRYYGGGFKIAPDSLLDSGKITICAVEKISNALMSIIFPTVLFGKHKKFPFVKFYEGERVELYIDDYKNLNIDGNVYSNQNNLEFEIVKKTLKLFIP